MEWNTEISGQHIYLRTLTSEDVTHSYVDWLNDPDVNRYLETRFQVQTKESVVAFVTAIQTSDHSYLFGIFLKEDDRHIGNIKLGPVNPHHRRATISLLIGDKSQWGRGLATEAIGQVCRFAFAKLNLRKVDAGCYANNLGSLRAFMKNGFAKEGILKEHYISDGCSVDGIILGLMHSEWKMRYAG